MKKILVVLTGGTIGSRIEGSTIDVTDGSAYYLISLYKEKYGKEDTFEVIQPFSVLSENMNPSVWTKLISALWEIRWEEYQGIIITHGSDTLAYTSALVGMLFCHVPVPVVLTASNYPLGEKNSNGLENFKSSVELVKTPRLRGVFTVYRNDGKESCVYLASRLTEADCYLDKFGAFGGSVFGKMEQGKLVEVNGPVNPGVKELCRFCREGRTVTDRPPVFEKQVLMIRPYPGMDYDLFDLTKRPAAVLHYLYHSATACTEGEAYSLPGFLERCRREGIPVYTASYKDKGGAAYVTAKEILKTGAIPMMNISPEAAYMKLLLLYNCCPEKEAAEKIMNGENLYYEHLPGLSYEEKTGI